MKVGNYEHIELIITRIFASSRPEQAPIVKCMRRVLWPSIVVLKLSLIILLCEYMHNLNVFCRTGKSVVHV